MSQQLVLTWKALRIRLFVATLLLVLTKMLVGWTPLDATAVQGPFMRDAVINQSR